jgi:RNA polymerase sigma-70 factor, ECF subfamily
MSPSISQALAAQLIAHLPALRRYAMALCGNAALADDLVQDGIERALTRAPSLREPERLGAWMRSIVHNLFVDELRRRRSRGTSVDVATIENDLALSTAQSDRSISRDLERAMAGLSLEHRQILVLAGVEELSYRQIADELAVPLGTVMSRLARARAALRAALEPAIQEPPTALREQRP